MAQAMKCPKCGEQIEVADILTKDIQAKVETEFRNRMEKERQEAVQAAEKKARESMTMELTDLQGQLKEEKEKREASQKLELELRKKQRDLEEAQKNLELDVARKMDEERKKIEETATNKVLEETRLRESEKDKKLQDAMRQIEDMQRKMAQGSQQAQGEVLELEFENMLKREFPLDDIAPVAKGVKGGDVIQTVRTRSGMECGKILWELKRTKTWSEGWLAKLKDDGRDAKASMLVLVSEAVPSGFKHFKQMDGVWVSEIPYVLPLAFVLRSGMVAVATAKETEAGKKDKAELVYDYLTGGEFKNRVSGIVEAYKTMMEDLEGEKRAMTRMWEKRAKQIEKAIHNTAGMCGEIEGLAGSKELESVKLLQLESAGA